MNPTVALKKSNEKSQKPLFGWQEQKDGWLVAPDDFAQSTAFITDEYDWWSEKMRSRWDLVEYIKTYFKLKKR